MLRTALRPRWLALLLVVLVAAGGMARLGQWQLDRARDAGRRAQEKRLSAPPVDLASLLQPRRPYPTEGIDRPVTASGRWDGDRTLLLPGREHDGRRGLWVLTPLVLTDGSAVPVVRGWVATADDPAATRAPAPQNVTIVGVLQPPEPRLDTEPGTDLGLPAGQIPRIDVTDLVKRWPHPMVDAYVRQTSQTPAAQDPAPLAVPVTAHSEGVAWRNLSYALQWWIFCGFGLFLWWRLVRDDHLERTAPVAPFPSDQPEPEASS